MQPRQGSKIYQWQVPACEISQSFGEKKVSLDSFLFLGNPWYRGLDDGEDSGVTHTVSLDLLRS